MGKLMDMVEVFEGLEDWRNAQQTRHRLSELLTICHRPAHWSQLMIGTMEPPCDRHIGATP